MRLSDSLVVQLVEGDPPRLVLLDESSGAEISMDREEVGRLIRAIEYFTPGMLRMVGDVAADDVNSDHVLDLREDGWTLQHPLMCRLSGMLFDCPVNLVVQATLTSRPDRAFGQYKVTVEGGVLVYGDEVVAP